MHFDRRAARVGALAVATFLIAVGQASAASGPCGAKAPAPGGDWPSYGRDARDTRDQPAEKTLSAAGAAALTKAWSFDTAAIGDTSGAFNGPPIVAGGCVFADAASGWVYALDQATGALRWKTLIAVATPGLGGALVGSPAVDGDKLIVLVNETGAPYAVALDKQTGARVWRSPAVDTDPGSYTNASAVVFDDTVFVGVSPPEGGSRGQGGFGLVDADTGALLKFTYTVPPADQAKGYAGGGLWATPAYDRRTGYAYEGAGNPDSKTVEHPNTNAILKIDLGRSRPTFGAIVAHYKGEVDQYTDTLEGLSQTPVCAASDSAGAPAAAFTFDDPACGQLDLDFGASPNLFTDSSGRLRVGDLQKSGVYHVADATTMAPVWATLVGASCASCNAASTAVDADGVYGVGTPGGVAFALNPSTGAVRWQFPTADGVHYQPSVVADGVTYTTTSTGAFEAFDTHTGTPVLERPMAQDTGTSTAADTSAGLAVADHTVFVATAAATSAGNGPVLGEGHIVAYRVPGSAAKRARSARRRARRG